MFLKAKEKQQTFQRLSKTTRIISQQIMWNIYYWLLPKPKVKTPLVPNMKQIEADLKEKDFTLQSLDINQTEFSAYLEQAQYSKYPNYYGGGTNHDFAPKGVQHFLAAKLLNLSSSDIYLDIASFDSPVSEIYQRLYGCKTYNQDLMFPKGIHGTTIGGDACAMPVADGFATKMALHCSLEHFEKDSDIRFIQEANRVLRKGGKLCVVPLYLFQSYAVLTNPLFAKRNTQFDQDAVIYSSKNWHNRHGRFYDAAHLVSRIRDRSSLKMTVYTINCDIPSWKDQFFAALFEKES
jgi:SAM-dependent methyltransferase